MKKLLPLLILCLLIPATHNSLAQTPNQMGLYFDLDGQYNCLDASLINPYQVFSLYLILLNPTFDQLYGFECGITTDGPSTLIGTTYFGSIIDIGEPGNYIVGLGEPLPMGEVNPLLDLSFLYTGTADDQVCFTLHGSDPSSIDPALPTVLLADGQLMSTAVDPGPLGGSCTARIGICALATDHQPWDALKSLYR